MIIIETRKIGIWLYKTIMKNIMQRITFATISFLVLSCTGLQKNRSFYGLNNSDSALVSFDESIFTPSGSIVFEPSSEKTGNGSTATNDDSDRRSSILFYNNLFREYKNYSHIFIGDIYDNSKPIIPCESTYDLAIAKRLGFRVSEANIQATATPGKYVVMHGVSGTIGGQLVNLDGTSAADVVIADTTFDELRNNYKYKSIYEKYQTPIVSLEEWLTQCKILGLIPLVSYVDDISLNIVKGFFGSDFILYNGTRDRHNTMIMMYQHTYTKEEMVSLCEEYGAPLMINVSSLSNYETDEALIEAIQEVHKNDCLFGVCGCYMSATDTLRAWRCGADFSASNSEVNRFENGDICDLDGELSFDGFNTNGEIANNVVLLAPGETISVSQASIVPFLHANQLEIIFEGKISISMSGAKEVNNIYSDGTKIIRWSGFAINQAPFFIIEALSNTQIKSIKYQAKIM